MRQRDRLGERRAFGRFMESSERRISSVPDALVPQQYRRIIEHRSPTTDGQNLSRVQVFRRRELDHHLVRWALKRLEPPVFPLEEPPELGSACRAGLDADFGKGGTGEQDLLELRRDEAATENRLAPRGREVNHGLDERVDGDHFGVGHTHDNVWRPHEDARVRGRGQAEHVRARVDAHRDVAVRLVARGDVECVNEHRSLERLIDNRGR